tara:strand:+ start:1457 stop:1645 length:189 start_codon:yes stop_codon:yes gene_type:complete
VIIQAIILTTLLTNDPMIVIIPPSRAVEGALFNEYDWEYTIEAKRRRGKGNKGRRRGGNGLR